MIYNSEKVRFCRALSKFVREQFPQVKAIDYGSYGGREIVRVRGNLSDEETYIDVSRLNHERLLLEVARELCGLVSEGRLAV